VKPRLRRVCRITAVLGLIGLITSCPLPYDFSGEGAGQEVTSDPSSPHITAPVAISYSEEGGVSGTLANDGIHVSSVTTTVTLSTDTENAVIYYTDDGREITSFGSVKKISGSTGSITINRSAGVEIRDIRAVAVGSGMLPSPPIHGTVSVSAFPILSVTAIDAQVFEGGAETGFTIQSSEMVDADLTVNLSTDGDYEAEDVSGLGEAPGGPGITLTAIIPAGSDFAVVDWSPGSDPDEFDDETVILIIEPGDGYAVGTPASATCIIQDDMTPTISISQSSSSIFDDGGINLVTITSNLTLATQDLVVTLRPTGSYEAADLSSVPAAGTNFTMTIPAGSNYAEREIQASADPGEFDDESVTLTVLDGAEYNVGTPSSVSFVIEDTSPVPQLTLSANRVSMTDVQSTTFTVWASVAPDANLTVSLSGSGFDPARVSSAPSSVTIPGGATSATFSLTPLTEVGYERTVATYSIASGTGYSVGSPSSRSVTIIDDVYGSFEYVGYWTGAQTTSPVGTGASMTFVGEAGTIGDRIYVNGDADRGDDARVNVSGGLDKNSFTVAVMFRMASFRNPGGTGLDRPIIIGGPSYRWMQLVTDGEGDLRLRFNNGGQVFDLTGLVPTLMINNTYLAVINVDVPALTATVHFGGGVPMPSTTVALPGGFVWDVEVEHNTTFDEIIQARSGTMPFASFDGEYDFYFVANGILRTDEVMDLISTDPDV
jgi:hypothetical protein